MRHLLVYLKEYKKEAIIAPLFKLLESSFDLITPLVMASIIDAGIRGRDTGHVLKMVGVLVLLAAVGLTCAVIAQYFAAKTAVGFSAKVRYALFSHIETLAFPEMDGIGTSTLITRLTSDINQMQSGLNLALRLLLRSPFIVFGAMIMAFTVNVKAALVFVVTIPLLSIVVFGVMVVTMPMYKGVQKRVDGILGHTRENLAGARVIRAFDQSSHEEEVFCGENELLTNCQIAVGRISGLTNPLTYVIVNCAAIAVIWTAGEEVFAGVITQGEVVALVNYMSQILVELIKLANLIVSISKALVSASRVEDVLLTKSSLENGTGEAVKDSTREYIEFEHASLMYAGTQEDEISDVTLKVKKGQTIGIIGGTGSGKTTLVHMIPRFYDATAGAVYVDGRNVKDYPLEELRGRIGMVMQKAVLFSGTIEENLRWGKPDATEEEMWRALEIAQAIDVVKGKEEGLKHRIEEGGKNLSGGQKQRLTIARAVIRDPEILIFDDSASALDFATDAKLRKALEAFHGEKTVFIVSQRTSSIQSADQIVVLDDGLVAGIGTHEELLAGCEVYREIYESQFRKEELQENGAGKEV